MTINFLRAILTIQDYAARQALNSNELALLLALLRVYNERRWPDGAQSIGNNELLSHCTFHGAARDKTLRQVRERLQARGVIAVQKGEAHGALPRYAICWEALGLAAEQDGDRIGDRNGDKKVSETVGTETNHVSPAGINKNINKNKPADAVPEPVVCEQAARTQTGGAWFDPARPDRPCDSAWQHSMRARAAIAQRMIDYAAQRGMREEHRMLRDDYGQIAYIVGPDLLNVMCQCMERGMPPGAIMRCRAEDTAAWSLALRHEAGRHIGYAAYPEGWREALEMAAEEDRRRAVIARARERASPQADATGGTAAW